MDSKDIIKDPQLAIETVWKEIDSCPYKTEILSTVTNIKEIKKKLKQLKVEKQNVAKAFKLHPDNDDEKTKLKDEMSVVSGQTKQFEKERRLLEKHLLSFFEPTENKASGKEKLPIRFIFETDSSQTEDVAEIRETDSSIQKKWNDYVNKHPNSSPYHLFEWKQVIESVFGHKPYYLSALDKAGELVGILPLVNHNSFAFGNYAVSMPYFNYGGPLANSKGVGLALMEHANQIADNQSWSSIEYRTCRGDMPFGSVSKKASMILSLPDTFQELEDSFGAKVRSQYKKTDRLQPKIEFGKERLIPEFYHVFARNMRDLGTPVYSIKFFESIFDNLRDLFTVVVVKLDNKPVGSAILCGHQDMLEIPWASTLKKFNSTNINMWMYQAILKFATEQGYKHFDFGRSTIDSGTYQFKKQWGAKPINHHWYYYLPNGKALPELNPDNPKYKLAIKLWKKLPLFIANLIGPGIVKNLP